MMIICKNDDNQYDDNIDSRKICEYVDMTYSAFLMKITYFGYFDIFCTFLASEASQKFFFEIFCVF